MPIDYLTLEYALEFQSLENIIGATFHDNYLLVYSENLLTILDLSQNTTQKPIIKFLQGFQPKKLGKSTFNIVHKFASLSKTDLSVIRHALCFDLNIFRPGDVKRQLLI